MAIHFLILNTLQVYAADVSCPIILNSPDKQVEGALKNIKPAIEKIRVFKVGQRVFSNSKQIPGTIEAIDGDNISVRYDGLGDSGEVIHYTAQFQRAGATYTVVENPKATSPGQVMDQQKKEDLWSEVPKDSDQSFYDLKSAMPVKLEEVFTNGKKKVSLISSSVSGIPDLRYSDQPSERLVPSSANIRLNSIVLKPGGTVVDKSSGMRSKIEGVYYDSVTKKEYILVKIPYHAIAEVRSLSELGP